MATSGHNQGGKTEMNRETEAKTTAKIEEISSTIYKIVEGLNSLEETLYHASERKDKDVAKSAGACLCLLNGILEDAAGELFDLSRELNKEA